MQDKVFVDTNVLIYCYSSDEKDKQSHALEIFAKHENINISKQVINEFVNVLFRKFSLSCTQIRESLIEIKELVTILDFSFLTQLHAITLKERYNLQFFDALIVATALENGCDILYSEDMQDGLKLKNMSIINPF